jgi:hypothetical protein
MPSTSTGSALEPLRFGRAGHITIPDDGKGETSRHDQIRASSRTATTAATRNEARGGDDDAEADMPLAEAAGAMCVQRFDGSRNSAIHTTYRSSLRSSSIREPRYPLLRVVSRFATEDDQRGRPAARTAMLQKDRRPPGRRSTACVWSEWGKRKRRATIGPHRRPHKGATRDPRRSTGRPRARSGFDRFNDPSAGSPTETLLRLLLPLGGRV